MIDYILASASPRRQALLEQVGMPFRVVVSNADEAVDATLTPSEIVKQIALKKAEAVLNELKRSPNLSPKTIIIAADTVVAYNGIILGKPKDKADAYDMLSALSGNKHEVYTGVAIIYYNKGEIKVDNFADCATVYFRALDSHEITNYIETGEPMDKAGAYGIQEKGAILVEKIEGDFYTIVGLPLVRVYKSLHNIK